MLKQNIFENGTSGTAITPVGSGDKSGDVFTNVVLNGGTATYDNAHPARMSLGGRFTNVSGTGTYATFEDDAVGLADFYFRFYVYVTAFPTNTARPVSFLTSGDLLCGAIGITNTGKLTMIDATGSVQFTTASSITINTLYRIEGHVVGGATGSMELKFFIGQSTSPVDPLHLVSPMNTRGTIKRWRWGISNGPAAVVTLWLDEIAITDIAYLGPAATSTIFVGTTTGAGAGFTYRSSNTFRSAFLYRDPSGISFQRKTTFRPLLNPSGSFPVNQLGASTPQKFINLRSATSGAMSSAQIPTGQPVQTPRKQLTNNAVGLTPGTLSRIPRLGLTAVFAITRLVGTLRNVIFKPLFGSIDSTQLVGTLKNRPQKSFLGQFTISQLVGQINPKQVLLRFTTNSITPTGRILPLIPFLRGLKGGMTPVGIIAKQFISKILTGGNTPVGTLAQRVIKILSGPNLLSLSPGTLTRKAIKVLTLNTIAPVGILSRIPSKVFLAGLTPVGIIAKRVRAILSGAISGIGSLSTPGQSELIGALIAAGAIVNRVFQTFTASNTPSANVLNRPRLNITGTGTPTATLTFFTFFRRVFSGNFTPNGNAVKNIAHSLSGSLSSIGTFAKSSSRILTGAITPSGAVRQGWLRFIEGVIGPVGVILQRASLHRQSGLSSSGNAVRYIVKTLRGVLTPAGVVIRGLDVLLFGGNLSPIGNLQKRAQIFVVNSGLSSAGDFTYNFLYRRVLSGALTLSRDPILTFLFLAFKAKLALSGLLHFKVKHQKCREVEIVKLLEPFALCYEQSTHLQALKVFGERVIIRPRLTLQDVLDGKASRCLTCHGGITITNQARVAAIYHAAGESYCPDCFGTGFTGGFSGAAYISWMLAETVPGDWQTTPQGQMIVSRPRVQFAWEPPLEEGDLIIRYRYWLDDETPGPEQGRFVTQEVNNVALRTGPKFPDETIYVAQETEIDNLPQEHPYYGVTAI